MKPIEGEPAFPLTIAPETVEFYRGLSERRYYIGQALQGLCANPELTKNKAELIGELSIYQADAVMQLLYPQQKEIN